MSEDPTTHPLLECLEGGGSGRGVSYYTTAMQCPRKLKLDEETPEESGTAATFKLDAGKVFHKLCELYHGGDNHAALEYDDVNVNPALAEGYRIFQAYRKHFPKDIWGEVLDVEMQIPRVGDNGDPLEEDLKKLELSMGTREVTCRIDMVIRLNEEQAARLSRFTGLTLEEGVYLVDHKTKGAEPKGLQFAEEHETQPAAYMMLFEAVMGVEPKGMIFNNVFRHKDMNKPGTFRDDYKPDRRLRSFSHVLAPFPDGPGRESILTWLHNAEILAGTDMPTRNCFTYAAGYVRACRHLHSGRCDQK